jgi:hypothetical protein
MLDQSKIDHPTGFSFAQNRNMTFTSASFDVFLRLKQDVCG